MEYLFLDMALIKNNAEVAAKIAVELYSVDEGKESDNTSYPVVIGGSILDTCITVTDDNLKVRVFCCCNFSKFCVFSSYSA